MCYLQNTNIAYALVPEPVTSPELYSTFFLTHLHHAPQVNAGGRAQVHFVLDETYEFRIDKELGGRYRPDRYYAVDVYKRQSPYALRLVSLPLMELEDPISSSAAILRMSKRCPSAQSIKQQTKL